MKTLTIILFIILSMNSYAQDKTTTIQFKYIENDDLRLINELNKIQFVNLTCSDTLMKNKLFFLSIEEYNLGKLIKTDSLSLTCEEHRNEIIMGSDTLIYIFNICDRIKYDNIKDIFKISLAGKLVKDSLDLIVKYPSLALSQKLKGSERHLFREVIQTKNNEATIKLNTKTPILAYTGPFETGDGNSYCLLDEESPSEWYNKYGVKHFYIFNLEIK